MYDELYPKARYRPISGMYEMYWEVHPASLDLFGPDFASEGYLLSRQA